MTLILGLETSCDETAGAVVEDGCKVLSSIVWSQYELHQRYSGVVPEIASRAHLERIYPVINKTIKQAGINLSNISAVAVGNRPGLIGSLIVGVSAAKALAWALSKPLIGIDHVQAHLYAPRLGGDKSLKKPDIKTSTEKGCDLGLVVSGGHTSLYKMTSPTDTALIGRTIDDAVGEAYDKAAVILELDDFPGGPAIDKLAKQGNGQAYDLPRSTLGADSLDFSFSGLKTAMLYTVRGQPKGRGKKAVFPRSARDLTFQQKADLAASFQAAAIDAIMLKIARAVDQMSARGMRVRSLVIGGGVCANSLLRQRAIKLGKTRNIPVHIPALRVCTDNAAMIAGLGYQYYQQGLFSHLDLPAQAASQTK